MTHWGFNIENWWNNLRQLSDQGHPVDRIEIHPATGDYFFNQWTLLNPHHAAGKTRIDSLFCVPVAYSLNVPEKVLELHTGKEVRWIVLGLLEDEEKIPIEFRINEAEEV